MFTQKYLPIIYDRVAYGRSVWVIAWHSTNGAERVPLKDDVYKTLNYKPKYMERKKIVTFVEMFYDDGFMQSEVEEEELLMAAEAEQGYVKEQ